MRALLFLSNSLPILTEAGRVQQQQQRHHSVVAQERRGEYEAVVVAFHAPAPAAAAAAAALDDHLPPSASASNAAARTSDDVRGVLLWLASSPVSYLLQFCFLFLLLLFVYGVLHICPSAFLTLSLFFQLQEEQ